MEIRNDQILDSPSKNSYIGSYYQPPDRIVPVPRQLDFSANASTSLDPQPGSRQAPQTRRTIDSKAVVNALKNLQEKIRQLELERKQAEKNFQQFSNDAQRRHLVETSCLMPSQQAASLLETSNSGSNELDSKLQSAEARCKILEKQLDYMRIMVENANRDSNTHIESQSSLQNQSLSQQNKLEKLESECVKLSRTQTAAERKLALLEQKLLQEEQERKRVQEKADELQRELNINLRLSMATNEEITPKKTKKTTKKTKQNELASPSGPRCQKMPFVAGTSLSPSHSVHANVQSILHMMKHHQPHLCERVSALHRSGCAARKSLQKELTPSSTGPWKKDSPSVQEAQSLSSLSDLLLALQDELGQMSFEHQELVRQIDSTPHREEKQDLQRELEELVTRMEEKGVHITKLRKHQHTVHKLTQGQPCAEEPTANKLSGIKPPAPSPVTAKQKGKKRGTTQNNLQLLRETQKFRNSLKQEDLFWET